MVYITVLYTILAWYFDNILPMNRGVPKPWFFIFTISYWLPFLKTETKQEMTLELDQGDNSASKEKNRIIKDELRDGNKSINGVRVLGLSKTY